MRGRIMVALAVAALLMGCKMFQRAEKSAGKPATNAATLSLTANVKGAEVFIDDMLFGQIAKAGAPQCFVVAGGKHTLVVKKLGYVDYKATIGVEAGGVNTLAVTLERTPAVPVEVPKEAPKPAPTK